MRAHPSMWGPDLDQLVHAALVPCLFVVVPSPPTLKHARNYDSDYKAVEDLLDNDTATCRLGLLEGTVCPEEITNLTPDCVPVTLNCTVNKQAERCGCIYAGRASPTGYKLGIPASSAHCDSIISAGCAGLEAMCLFDRDCEKSNQGQCACTLSHFSRTSLIALAIAPAPAEIFTSLAAAPSLAPTCNSSEPTVLQLAAQFHIDGLVARCEQHTSRSYHK